MTKLAQILQEIEKEALHNPEIGRKQCEGMTRVMNIIRKHMSRNDVYCPEDKKEDWIPVGDRLPEEKVNPITQDFYEYQVTFYLDGESDVRYYKFGNGHWWNWGNIMDDYVIAWRERPEPYQLPPEAAESSNEFHKEKEKKA